MQQLIGTVAVLLAIAVCAPALATWLTAAVPTLGSILVLLIALRVMWSWLT